MPGSRDRGLLATYDVIAPAGWSGSGELRDLFIGTAWTIERAPDGEPTRMLVKLDVLPHRGLILRLAEGAFELVPRRVAGT